MSNLQVNEAGESADVSFSPRPVLPAEPEDIPGMKAEVGPETIAENEADVGTACYMCHACTNFGVHGKEVRPCARGLSELINRRHRVRKRADKNQIP